MAKCQAKANPVCWMMVLKCVPCCHVVRCACAWPSCVSYSQASNDVMKHLSLLSVHPARPLLFTCSMTFFSLLFLHFLLTRKWSQFCFIMALYFQLRHHCLTCILPHILLPYAWYTRAANEEWSLPLLPSWHWLFPVSLWILVLVIYCLRMASLFSFI